MILIPLLHVIYTAVALASAKPEGEALSSFFVISNFEGLDMMWLCRNYTWFPWKIKPYNWHTATCGTTWMT